jgi:hypothetical protein
VARTTRVVFRWNGGSVRRGASEEEIEQSQQVSREIWGKWKKDPGIKVICYYLVPGIAHHVVFEVDDITKVAEMDGDIFAAKGLLIEDYSFETVLGNTQFDEWWESL